MVDVTDRRLITVLSGTAAILTLGVAGYSVTDPSLYRPLMPEYMIPGAVSQDIVSLLAAMGVLLCSMLTGHGKRLAWLVWLGLVGYLFSAYALYAFERVYNPLFLGYVAILGFVVYALFAFFRHADLSTVHPTLDRPPPRRTVAWLFLLLAGMFAALWLSILIPAMVTRVPPDGNATFVLDLAFLLPLLVIESVLLLRRRPLGDALAVPLLVKVGTLGLSVLTGTLLAPAFDQPIDAISVIIYAVLAVAPLLFVVPYLIRLDVSD